ncbi:MAG: NADH-quinone oxidoreductase subunit F [Actinomycetota bacterium]|nr:NADH-quinone oxidoreductase subunit F [Actinomycetota bacterium]
MTVPTPRTTHPPLGRRLLAARGPGLTEHHARFGALPPHPAENLIASLQAAGLTGRGGAGFPTGRKIASVTGGKPVVIGNGAEGEPLSGKDAALLTRAPHLVLDGLHAAAEAVGADTVYLYLPERVAPAVRSALAERVAAGLDERRVTVVEAPEAFVSGEESAVVRRIEGGPAIPRDRTRPTSICGVRGRPTLVNNVETLAHVALIARYGPRWFRSVGDAEEPGTMLITLSGALPHRGVTELPTGAPLTEVLARGGLDDLRQVGAVLLGGYHGSWIATAALTSVWLSRPGLAAVGASPGAGIVHLLPADQCGLARTADILAYLAEQGARQCGPCRNGLPRLAKLFDALAYQRVDDELLDETDRMLGLVDGRGACRHPDGTVRLARSALNAFAGDLTEHQAGRCTAALVTARTADRRGARPPTAGTA